MEESYEWIRKALAIARAAHRGAVDKGGDDYIFHPVTVALLCERPEERTVALLHDVVEDTALTLDELRRAGFPEAIVAAVDAVTRRADEEGDAGRMAYLRRVKADPIARAVKRADLCHNSDLTRIPSPTEKDRARVAAYAREIAFLEE